MKYDILCVGSVEAELVFTTKLSQPTSLVPRLRRAQQSQTHIEAREAVFGMAGDAYLAAVACARLGLKTALRAQVGADSLGSEAARRLQDEGVDTRLLLSSPQFATSVSTVIRSVKDEQLSMTYKGKAQEYDKKTFVPPILASSDAIEWLYITGINNNLSILRQLLDWAKKHGVQVAIQARMTDLPQSRRALQLLSRAAIVLLECDDAEFFTHQSDAVHSLKALRTSGLQTVIVHDGLELAWGIHDGFLYTTHKFGSTHCVSSSGTNDAFNASFLASYIAGHELEACLGFGLVAARSVGCYVGSDVGLLRSFGHRAGKVSKKFL